jgi:hypothetical protein
MFHLSLQYTEKVGVSKDDVRMYIVRFEDGGYMYVEILICGNIWPPGLILDQTGMRDHHKAAY